MSKHSAAKRRARKEKCPGFLAEHVQPDPSQLSRQLGASSQAVLHLPTGAGASLGHSGARGHTTQCLNLWGHYIGRKQVCAMETYSLYSYIWGILPKYTQTGKLTN